MSISFGPYLFGDVPAPFLLPCPWMWDCDPCGWLTAIGPGCKRYATTKDELHLLDESADGWRLAEDPPINHRPEYDIISS